MTEQAPNALLGERAKLVNRVIAGKAFLIKTPPAARLLADILQWLITGARGACVFGPPTIGKTSAIRWALGALPQLVGGTLPWYEIPIRGEENPYKREFFQHCLRCVKHKHYQLGTGGDKRDRFSEFLIGRAKGSTLNCVVLFLDEAQQLQPKQFEWLLDIGNEADARGSKIFFILGGQKKLVAMRDEFIASGDMQFVARFLSRMHSFSPLTSAEDLHDCYLQFGETVYPRGAGNPYFPQHFVPISWEQGFRPEQLVPSVWQEFSKISEIIRPGHPVSVPMANATVALMTILNECSNAGFVERVVPLRIVEGAVWRCGYQEELGSVNPVDKPSA